MTYLRVNVFVRPEGKSRRRRCAPLAARGYAYQLHNADLRIERAMGRLEGSGSFYWDNPRRAYRAAVVALRKLGAVQVKIETISGRPVARLYRDERGITAHSEGAA
jgi:hypothetical protein